MMGSPRWSGLAGILPGKPTKYHSTVAPPRLEARLENALGLPSLGAARLISEPAGPTTTARAKNNRMVQASHGHGPSDTRLAPFRCWLLPCRRAPPGRARAMVHAGRRPSRRVGTRSHHTRRRRTRLEPWGSTTPVRWPRTRDGEIMRHRFASFHDCSLVLIMPCSSCTSHRFPMD